MTIHGWRGRLRGSRVGMADFFAGEAALVKDDHTAVGPLDCGLRTLRWSGSPWITARL